MRVVEARSHQPALQLDDARPRSDEAGHRRVVAHRRHPLALDGEGGGRPPLGDEHAPAAQHEVGVVTGVKSRGHEAQ